MHARDIQRKFPLLCTPSRAVRAENRSDDGYALVRARSRAARDRCRVRRTSHHRAAHSRDNFESFSPEERHTVLIHCSASAPPNLADASWEDLWLGDDAGLIVCWRARQQPELAEAAKLGEFPVLAWKGGGEATKAGKRLGALHYLATWQGLRGEDLNIDTDPGETMTCTRTGTVFTSTSDVAALGKQI